MSIPYALSFLAIVFAIFAQLDASPALYLAEIYVRLFPSTLNKVFVDGSVIVITGASDGIGAETARQLCSKTSTNLIVIARTAQKLEAVKKDCQDRSGVFHTNAKISAVIGDVTSGENELRRLIQQGLDELGKTEVDIGIVNAGRAYRGAVDEVPENIIRDVMLLNYMGAVSTVKAITSTFNPTNPHPNPKAIIGISSVGGKVPFALSAGYAASKAAMIAFFDSLRAEIGTVNMRITTVCPGPVTTNIRKSSLEAMGLKAETYTEKELKQQMDVTRAVNLMLAGSVASPYWMFHELWFSPQPILSYFYLSQFIPDLVKYVGKPVGSCRGGHLCEEMKRQHQRK